MDDRQIIRLLWKRAEESIEALARKFGQGLQAMAMNILGNPQDAEECVNDTYLAVWNAVPPQKPDPLAGFVFRIGRNQALNKRRGNTAQKRDGRYDLSLEELAGCIPGSSLEDTLAVRQLGMGIDAFLHTLSKENRIMFLRRYWFGDSIGQIARHFDMTENAVTVRLSRSRTKLKHYLIKEGFVHEGEIS